MSEERNVIAVRRKEIATNKASHLAAIEALDAESAELDIAERVFARLMGGPKAHVSSPQVSSPPSQATSGKPPNTPTVPEMILELLGTRAHHGLDGLDSKGLTQLIGEKWWPGVTGAEINPIAWRMAKRGQLIKEGGHYRLPRNPLMDPSPPEGDDPPDDA